MDNGLCRILHTYPSDIIRDVIQYEESTAPTWKLSHNSLRLNGLMVEKETGSASLINSFACEFQGDTLTLTDETDDTIFLIMYRNQTELPDVLSGTEDGLIGCWRYENAETSDDIETNGITPVFSMPYPTSETVVGEYLILDKDRSIRNVWVYADGSSETLYMIPLWQADGDCLYSITPFGTTPTTYSFDNGELILNYGLVSGPAVQIRLRQVDEIPGTGISE